MKKYDSTRIVVTVFLILLSSFSQAAVQLSPIFTEGAILQRDHPVPVWGKSEPNQKIEVALGNEKRLLKSNKDGVWEASFSPRLAGESERLVVKTSNETMIVNDIVFGDVWLCGGQSNMEWVLRDSLDGEQEIAAANYPLIRHFKVPRTWSVTPDEDLAGSVWYMADSDNAANFSAIGYFFAKNIHHKTKVPIGLIGANWGGSTIESWMSSKALGEEPEESINRIETISRRFLDETATVKKYLQRWPDALVDENVLATADFSARKLDTKNWVALQAPSLWETQRFVNVDGVIWYRKEFLLSEQEALNDIILGLGRIDDNDKTWINGELIGATEGYSIVRRYSVPSQHLHTGRNTIAVRIEDTGGGGGIYSDRELLFIQFGNGTQKSLAGEWLAKPDKVQITNKSELNHVPTALYNKMIYPLFRMPIKGILWYQGESNANSLVQAQKYPEQFERLISSWRQSWQNSNLPFYWVQLASYNSKGDTSQGSPWATLREAQSAALHLENTGQVITLDVGNADDIHPRDKQTVGKRLAAIALDQLYGKPTHHRGPVLKSARWNNDKIIVTVDASAGLSSAHQQVQGFEVFDKEGAVFALTGVIEGESVVLDASDIPFEPKLLGYAWRDNPESANLQDKKGLPAEPVRLVLKR